MFHVLLLVLWEFLSLREQTELRDYDLNQSFEKFTLAFLMGLIIKVLIYLITLIYFKKCLMAISRHDPEYSDVEFSSHSNSKQHLADQDMDSQLMYMPSLESFS